MNTKHLATLLGLTSVIVFNPLLSVKAEPVIYSNSLTYEVQ
ncbi:MULTISPECIES: hypothetical protein [Microcystis]|nr:MULTISPECIES: hypothetical protein [Microcystis]